MMLAISVFCDAHFHIVPYAEKVSALNLFLKPGVCYEACSCAHGEQEFLDQERMIAEICTLSDCIDGSRSSGRNGGMNSAPVIYPAFGMHPQLPLIQNADFMEKLLKENRICAIGEAGIDLFTPEFRAEIAAQEEAWHIQMELAVQYDKPLIIHCRKALDIMFRDSKILKKLPGVLFHSFYGGMNEARALLNRGINAYFSFGKQIMNGNKRAVSCTAELPFDRLLLETDAPFQTLKGEEFTKMEDIKCVYETAYELRNNNIGHSCSKSEFFSQIKRNFHTVFCM